jgi:chorismate mutase/prephenate dehydratase
MNIEYWRAEIDEVDRELLRLLNRRARLAIKVGALKQDAALPCCDPERERVVLATLGRVNTGPLGNPAVAKLFRRIIRESRRLEAGAGSETPRGAGELTAEALDGSSTEPFDLSARQRVANHEALL